MLNRLIRTNRINLCLARCAAPIRAYFNVPTGTDVLGDWKSVLEDLVIRA